MAFTGDGAESETGDHGMPKKGRGSKHQKQWKQGSKKRIHLLHLYTICIYIYIYIYVYICIYVYIYIYICIYCVIIYIYTYTYTCRIRSEGKQKACRPTVPKMGPRRSASQRNVSKGAGMPVLFCSKHDCHKQCQDMRTASSSIQDPGRNPRHPQISKLTYFRTLQSYTGSGAMFARAYPHTSRGNSVKLAIRIGLAAKLLSMCSKATKHGVAFRIGLAAKLLRMRSEATKDDFEIRIGSAAKLLRKCFKE